jgi:hypothetical protein
LQASIANQIIRLFPHDCTSTYSANKGAECTCPVMQVAFWIPLALQCAPLRPVSLRRKPHRQCITPHINSQNGVSVLDRHWTVPSKNLTANAFSRYTLDGSSDQSTLEGSTQKPHCRCFQPRYFGLLLQPINFGWITNPPNGITVDVFSQYT